MEQSEEETDHDVAHPQPDTEEQVICNVVTDDKIDDGIFDADENEDLYAHVLQCLSLSVDEDADRWSANSTLPAPFADQCHLNEGVYSSVMGDKESRTSDVDMNKFLSLASDGDYQSENFLLPTARTDPCPGDLDVLKKVPLSKEIDDAAFDVDGETEKNFSPSKMESFSVSPDQSSFVEAVGASANRPELKHLQQTDDALMPDFEVDDMSERERTSRGEEITSDTPAPPASLSSFPSPLAMTASRTPDRRTNVYPGAQAVPGFLAGSLNAYEESGSFTNDPTEVDTTDVDTIVTATLVQEPEPVVVTVVATPDGYGNTGIDRDGTGVISDSSEKVSWKKRFYCSMAMAMVMMSFLGTVTGFTMLRQSDDSVDSTDETLYESLVPIQPTKSSVKEEHYQPTTRPFSTPQVTLRPSSTTLFLIFTSSSPTTTSSVVDRFDAMKAAIGHLSARAAFEDETSPQYRALRWLALEDEAQVPVSDGSRLEQRYVLTMLYYSTGGEHWGDQYGFLTSKPECYWRAKDSSGDIHGVERCNSYQQVTVLDLRSNKLEGILPSEIGFLTKMEKLWLRSNSLSGTIPSEIGMMTDLTQVALRSNQFVGSIPSEMGRLYKLQNLWLHDNSLSGNIPTVFGSFTQLITCNLRSNYLTGTVPSTLSHWKTAKSIYLHRNNLVGSVDFLCDLKNLTVLYVDKSEVYCSCCC